MYTVQILQVIKSYHSTSVLHVSQLAFSSVARKLDGLDKVVAFSYVETITELASWLQSLGLAGTLADGRQVHRNIVCKGLDSNSFLGNSLVQFYSRCLDIVSAQFCFERVKHRNVFSWNFLMGAYDGIGHHEDVLFCFQQLRMENIIPDGVTFVHVLSAYSTNQVSLLHAKQIHTCVLAMGFDSNVILTTALFDLYSKGKDWELTCRTFACMPQQDIASWNAFIAVCVQQGKVQEAFQGYQQLQQEGFIRDDITLVNLLTALSSPVTLVFGKQLHASVHHKEMEKNVLLGTCVANMYGKCGCLSSAESLFDRMSVRNVITWNSMITIYAQHGRGQEAMQLYQQMQQNGVAVNDSTFVGLLDACAKERLLIVGRILHSCLVKYAFDVDVSVGTALVHMYNKCLHLDEGQAVFNLLSSHNVVSFNTMMTGYVHIGQGKKALDVFSRMQHEGVVADDTTMSLVLSACALESLLTRGRSMHSRILKCGFDLNVVVKNSILSMYGKCGCVYIAQRIFNGMGEKNLVSWNSVIASHAQHGNCLEVFGLLFEMNVYEVVPDKTTYTSILSVCSHAGFLHLGSWFLFLLISEYDILPSVDLFDCIIDMLARAGQLDTAEIFLHKMPIQPRNFSWTTLLAASKCSADVARGFLAAKFRIEVDIDDPSAFYILLDMYTASGTEENAIRLMDSLLLDVMEL